MNNPEIQSLINTWRNRLRNLRSGDHVDAATLLATPSGPQIMSIAISGYLLDWVKSDWVDETEIEMLALDLSNIWPHGAIGPSLKSLNDERYQSYCELFLDAYRSADRNNQRNLADEIVDFEEIADAIA